MRKWLPIFLLSLPLHAQVVGIFSPASFVPQAAASATPGFVGETSKNSLTTNALAATNSGVCLSKSWSYCLSFPDVIATGDTGIISFQYNNGSVVTATTVTGFDDKSDTFACLTGSVDSTTGKWNGVCTGSLTSGAHAVGVTFGTTAVTQAMVEASAFYNLGAVDAHTSCFGATTTTANCGSVTTTQANDLIYVQVCRTGTPLSTSAFQPGSGFTLSTTQYQDGCATQFEIASGTGSTTPTMTLGGTSTYIEFVTAIKSTTAGSAPTGNYVQRVQSWTTPENSSGSFVLQLPSSGNMLYATSVCGTLVPTTVTDSGTNVWGATGTFTNGGTSAGNLLEWFVPQAVANQTSTQTFTTTGSGATADCTFTQYDIAGAPASGNPFVERHAFTGTPTTTTLMPATAVSYTPNATAHAFWANGGQAFNTSISTAQPSSGCYWDSATYSGMSINGPQPLDQNNIWDHCYYSTLGTLSFQANLGASTSETNAYVIDLVSFLSSTGIAIINSGNNQATSGSSLAVTVPSTRVGNLLVVSIGMFDGATARTVTKVCTDGTTCAAGNSFTQVPSAHTANTTQVQTDIWYLPANAGGVTTVTITYSGAITNAEAIVYELQKGSGGTWSVANSGNGAIVTNGSVASSTATGASITPTAAATFCASLFGVSNAVSAAPKSGSAWVYPSGAGTIFSHTTDGAVALLTTSTSAQAATVTDASGTFNNSTACFN
jgi:hypothetical protein